MKKVISLCLAAALCLGLFTCAFAAKPQEMYADKLSEFGLFKGTQTGYDLDQTVTRSQAAVMLVRLLGAEETAQQASEPHPFSDLPYWASKEIAYLYSMGIARGVSQNTFGSDDLCNAKMYTTFMLRALGYSDKNGDFTYDDCLNFGADKNLFSSSLIETFANDEFVFLRDDLVLLSYNALYATMKGQKTTLYQKLVNDGIIPATFADGEDTDAIEAAQVKTSLLTGIDATISGQSHTRDYDRTTNTTTKMNIKANYVNGKLNASIEMVIETVYTYDEEYEPIDYDYIDQLLREMYGDEYTGDPAEYDEIYELYYDIFSYSRPSTYTETINLYIKDNIAYYPLYSDEILIAVPLKKYLDMSEEVTDNAPKVEIALDFLVKNQDKFSAVIGVDAITEVINTIARDAYLTLSGGDDYYTDYYRNYNFAPDFLAQNIMYDVALTPDGYISQIDVKFSFISYVYYSVAYAEKTYTDFSIKFNNPGQAVAVNFPDYLAD